MLCSKELLTLEKTAFKNIVGGKGGNVEQFYATSSIDKRHIVFCPICLSVHLQKTFNIGVSFLMVNDSRSSVWVKIKYQDHNFWKMASAQGGGSGQ